VALRSARTGRESSRRRGAARRRPGARDRSWLARAVLYPFALTRAALLFVAWFAGQFGPSWTYFDPVGAARGWSRVPWLALDVWGARHLTALAASNAPAVAGLAAVYLAVRDAWGDARLARRAVLYLLVFPAGFFLSCAYAESLYLALSAAAFLLAGRGRWWWSGLCALLLGLTRPSGVLVAPVLAGMYLARGSGRPRLRWDTLALLAAPAGLAAHAARLAALTADPLALFHAQSAWGRALATPWATLLRPAAWHAKMGPLELAALLLFLALGARLLAERRIALGAFALLSLAPVLFSGTLMSATRFLAVIFPAFAALAQLGEREGIDRAVLVTFATGQALLFFAWSRFYWVA